LCSLLYWVTLSPFMGIELREITPDSIDFMNGNTLNHSIL
jgi:hypothetical protein